MSLLECIGRRGRIRALRLSGIEIPKNALLPSQLPAPVSSSEEEDVHGNAEEDAHVICQGGQDLHNVG
jgi:hypothetical protein